MNAARANRRMRSIDRSINGQLLQAEVVVNRPPLGGVDQCPLPTARRLICTLEAKAHQAAEQEKSAAGRREKLFLESSTMLDDLLWLEKQTYLQR